MSDTVRASIAAVVLALLLSAMVFFTKAVGLEPQRPEGAPVCAEGVDWESRMC